MKKMVVVAIQSGRDGDDLLYGGQGNDPLFGAKGNDLCDGQEGWGTQRLRGLARANETLACGFLLQSKGTPLHRGAPTINQDFRGPRRRSLGLKIYRVFLVILYLVVDL